MIRIENIKTTELSEKDLKAILKGFNDTFSLDRPLDVMINQYVQNPFGYSWHNVVYDDDKVVGFAIYTGTARDQEIPSLTLEITATDASSVTSYSIEKYEVGGSLISSETGIAGVVGNTVSVEDALKATFYSADKNKKYVFDTTNESNVLSKELVADAASNVLKLYFKAYGKHTATVHSVCGSNVVADITGSWYADETPATLYWPKVVSCSDGYYVISANSEDPLYGHTFSTSELEKTVTYTLDENIVYYAEYENILTDKNSYVYFPEKSSKGGSRCIQKSGVMKTAMNLATAGVYDIILAGGNRDGSHTCDVKVYLIDSESNLSEETIINRTLTNGEWMGEETASNVSIPAGSEIYFANDNGEGNAKFAGDYIIVRKSNVSVPVTAAGWATLYTTVPLDFSGVEGLTAYTASLSGSTVTLTAVDNVPANTGVVLKGAAKTYEIPAIASSTTAKGDLEGSTTAVDVTADAENVYYVLAKSGDADARFAKVSSGSIAAGKAYLKVAKAGAREFFAIGGDDVTAIESVKAQQMNGEVYNLNGQRVAAPQKGLYIVNGKKVVLK